MNRADQLYRWTRELEASGTWREAHLLWEDEPSATEPEPEADRYCAAGHLQTAATTSTYRGTRGWMVRRCLLCARAATARSRQRKEETT